MECGTGNPDSLASGVPFATTSVCRPGTQMTKIFQAKWSFVALQLLDLATTLFAFHLGGYDVNPLVARMAPIFGPIDVLLRLAVPESRQSPASPEVREVDSYSL